MFHLTVAMTFVIIKCNCACTAVWKRVLNKGIREVSKIKTITPSSGQNWNVTPLQPHLLPLYFLCSIVWRPRSLYFKGRQIFYGKTYVKNLSTQHKNPISFVSGPTVFLSSSCFTWPVWFKTSLWKF